MTMTFLVGIFLFCFFCEIQGRSEYAVVFPVHYEYSQNGLCMIDVINQTPQVTDVTVTSAFLEFSETRTLTPFAYTSFELSCSVRLNETMAVENKTVYVSSDFAVKVHVTNLYADDGGTLTGKGDSYLALPILPDYTEFTVVTRGNQQCPVPTPKAFYAIAAMYDNTEVYIYEPGNGGVEVANFILNASDAYQQFAESVPTDYTGMRIVTSQPVSVISGEACVYFFTGTCGTETYMITSIPPSFMAGNNYTVPPLAQYQASTPYTVRVVGLQDSTLVNYVDTGNAAIINKGEFNERGLPGNNQANRISCDKPCLVTLYSVEHGCQAPEVNKTGVFMTILTPNNLSDSQVIFAIPQNIFSLYEHYTSIASTSRNVLLNGASLVGSDWVENGWGYFHTNVLLSAYSNDLQAGSSGVEFMAYVYGYGSAGAGHGQYLHYGPDFEYVSTTTTEPTTTTTLPPVSDRNPNHRIDLTGTYRTVSGEVLTPECQARYGEILTEEANDMLDVTNAEISLLCTAYNVTGYILTSVSTTVFQNRTELKFHSSFPESVTADDVTVCSLDVSVYLQDHDNWDFPIMPPAECPRVEFPSGRFEESGYEWVCPTSADVKQANTPWFRLRLLGLFHTENNEDLTLTCTEQYSQEMESQVMVMVDQANAQLETGMLCAGEDGEHRVASSSTTFTAQGYQAQVSLSFFLDMDGSAYFSDFYNCSSDVLGYLANHDNWRDPILPQLPGCPAMIFQGEDFTPSEEAWYC